MQARVNSSFHSPGRFAGRAIACAGLMVLLAASFAPAQDPPQAAERAVAATVDGMPIHVESVEQAVERVVGTQAITPAARQRLACELLEMLIQRRLALAWLQARDLAASEDDLALAIAQLERGLAEQQLTLADYLGSTGLSESELRERLSWEIGWGRFLERQRTDENLARYFEHYRRQFDGTELRVSQILLAPAVAAGAPGHEEALAATLAEAVQLRARIVAGELIFAEAARQFSAAPSAAEGGEQGWIRRYEPMPESFSAAAFELEEGDISEPVASLFGVHLILCQEVKPGDHTWQDCREELTASFDRYLLEEVARRRRPDSVVEITGQLPYGGGE